MSVFHIRCTLLAFSSRISRVGVWSLISVLYWETCTQSSVTAQKYPSTSILFAMNQMKKWITDTSNWSTICNFGKLFLPGNNPTDWDLPSNIIDQLIDQQMSIHQKIINIQQKSNDVQTGNKFIIQTNIPNQRINPNPQFPETFKAKGKWQWNKNMSFNWRKTPGVIIIPTYRMSFIQICQVNSKVPLRGVVVMWDICIHSI